MIKIKRVTTLKDVAKKAGVSLSTASRVLNDYSSIKEDTKLKVKAAMKELGYKPNNIARSLKTNTTKTIGIIIQDITNTFYTEIIRGMDVTIKKYDYSLIIFNLDTELTKLEVALQLFYERKVDGMIYLGTNVDDDFYNKMKKLGVPVVLTSTSMNFSRKGNELFASVNIDNEKGAYDAVNYLCNLGHKKIAIIAGPSDDMNSTVPRITGYKKALKAHNLIFTGSMVYEGDFTFLSGYKAAIKMINEAKMPTAIFAISDLMAMGAARALLEHDYKIPKDVSVIGFDGIDNAVFFYPSLTTIKQPRYSMGVKSIQYLMKLIKGETIMQKDLILDYQLIKRESCSRV